LSSRRNRLRRPVARAVVLLGLAAVLAGCGFRPVYAPEESGQPQAAAQLAAVQIQPLRDRPGQQLHNFLRDELNPDGQPVKPDYRLTVDLSERIQKLAFEKDETATRANVILTSTFTLRAADDDRLLYAGRVSSINSYNILDEQYPTDVARADALRRGLREISQSIKLRLAVYFTSAEAEDLQAAR
jgi:LPS-assembly lipoprotein